MTTVQTLASNPFALMMHPDAVLAAVAGSDRLARLKSRICRPLDKPLLASAEDADAEGSDDSDRSGLGESTD